MSLFAESFKSSESDFFFLQILAKMSTKNICLYVLQDYFSLKSYFPFKKKKNGRHFHLPAWEAHGCWDANRRAGLYSGSTILRSFQQDWHWQHKVQQCHFLFKLLFYLHTERLQRPQHLQGQGSEWKTRVWQWEAHTKLVWAINPRKCC